MKTPCDDKEPERILYEKIIGLGEKSIRKSYYPLLRQKITELEREIAEGRRKEDELRRNYENQHFLNSLMKLSLEPIPLDDFFKMTLEKILSLSWMGDKSSASFFFVEDNPDVFVLSGSKTVTDFPGPSCDRVLAGHCFCGQAAMEGKTRFGIHEEVALAHSHYCVPIRFENKTIGIICIGLPGDHLYDPLEEEVLSAIANTLSGIIQRNRMIEEKSKLESQLRQTQKMEAIGSLAGGIAHDFNNLLTPILGYTEMVLQDIPQDSPMANGLAQVMKAAELAKNLVRQILTLSRQSKYELKPLRMNLVVNEALKLLRSTLPSTIQIKNKVEESDRTVFADPTQIHQVIMNLCTNSFHAMKKTGGILAVSLKTVQIDSEHRHLQPLMLELGSYQVLEVSDTGMGMSKSVIEKIFDPYFTTKSKEEGTGLGLSVVHGIIKSYGGHITVYSEPGHGTTFHVYLPCSEESALPDTEKEISPIPSGNEHIMVVDDEKTIVDLVTAMLKARGYTVTGCVGSIEALGVFQENPNTYALVITDMTMPHLTGAQLAKALQSIRPNIPLIVCTGFSELINEKKAAALGFQKYLMKPIIIRELCQTVRDVLDKHI
ncbi:MAG: ATP-binding protein [Desulfobacteraceae bacterium]|jgi:signal transduction histidine kinase